MKSETLYIEITSKDGSSSAQSIQCWDISRKLNSLQEQYMREQSVVRRIDKQTYMELRK